MIDYVVAHELSHLRVMDHSPRFWDTVGTVVPDYAQLRAPAQGRSAAALVKAEHAALAGAPHAAPGRPERGAVNTEQSQLHGRLSLQERLMLLVVISLLPLAALAIWFAVGEMRAATRLAQSQLKFAASLVAAHQDLIVESAQHLLGAISAMPEMRSPERKACESYFEQLRGRYPIYANIGLVDLQGKVVCHANGRIGDFSVADRPYFARALAERALCHGGDGDRQIDGALGHPLCPARVRRRPASAASCSPTLDLAQPARRWPAPNCRPGRGSRWPIGAAPC